MIVVASSKGRRKNGTLKRYKGAFTPCEKSTLSSNQKQTSLSVLGILLTLSAHLDGVLSLIIQSFLKPLQLVERTEQPLLWQGPASPVEVSLSQDAPLPGAHMLWLNLPRSAIIQVSLAVLGSPP